MTNITKANLIELATSTGFKKEPLEKVLRLYDILSFIYSDDMLSTCLALKGGTAINLTIFELTRLSVDIDLDFSINCSKEEMFNKREKISNRLKEFMFNNGYSLSLSSKKTHALDSFEFNYTNNFNSKDSLKIEINYLSRAHVLEPSIVSTKITFLKSIKISTLNKYELFGSKIKALIERCTLRDIYDVYHMIENNTFTNEELAFIRKIIVFYLIIGKSSNEEISDILIEFENKINVFNLKYIPQYLSSTLKKKDNFNLNKAIQIVKNFINNFIVLNENELQFLNEFKFGNYKPEILFDDEEILSRIRNHPMVLWKLKNLE